MITRKYWPIKLASEETGLSVQSINHWTNVLGLETKRTGNGTKQGNARLYNINHIQLFANATRFRNYSRYELIKYITDFGG